MEEWKTVIVNGEVYNNYMVSNLGRIKSLSYNRTKQEKTLKQSQQKGYLYVKLAKNGEMKSEIVHRLIAKTFISNPKNKPQVNHKDGNKLNNSVSNLEWCTNGENQKHAFNNGLKRRKFGKENPNATNVMQYDLQGNFIKEWGSISEADRELKISFKNISACCKGKRKTAGGFKWNYSYEYIETDEKIEEVEE